MKVAIGYTVFTFILIFFFAGGGCSAPKKLTVANPQGIMETVLIQPYGLFTTDNKHPDVDYDVVFGNVVWAILDAPVLTIINLGWYLWEPVGYKDKTKMPGTSMLETPKIEIKEAGWDY